MAEPDRPALTPQDRATLEAVYRAESRRVLATLIRLLGDFELAEEGLQEAFAAAAERWPREGVPAQPRAWLVTAGRFRAIDALRRRDRGAVILAQRAAIDATEAVAAASPEESIVDDTLRLIFTCCHPALAPEARIALTLREVCGLTTEEIARAFLSSAPTLAQRIVRAKARIRELRLPYVVPEPEEWDERLGAVLRVIYLIFNEGYAASSGPEAMRPLLAAEAIRLGRLLTGLRPDPEVHGLLALMLFQDSRRSARVDAAGDLVLLPEQDRTRWDRALIREAQEQLERAFATGRVGSYGLQAAIAGEHARAAQAEATDWRRILAFYDLLRQADGSPVVALNRAVALGEATRPEAGLAEIEALLARGELTTYALAHAARAEFLHRLGREAEAHAAWEQAWHLTTQEPEKRLLRRKQRQAGGKRASGQAEGAG